MKFDEFYPVGDHHTQFGQLAKEVNPGTVCPESSDPFYIASLLYKMGHYFLESMVL